jgi:hypothetical protein
MFFPGPGRVNVSYESLYVGISRVCHIDDLRILPYDDIQTLTKLADLQPSDHLSAWLESYSPIDDLLSEMVNFYDVDSFSFKKQKTPAEKKRSGYKNTSNPNIPIKKRQRLSPLLGIVNHTSNYIIARSSSSEPISPASTPNKRRTNISSTLSSKTAQPYASFKGKFKSYDIKETRIEFSIT